MNGNVIGNKTSHSREAFHAHVRPFSFLKDNLNRIGCMTCTNYVIPLTSYPEYIFSHSVTGCNKLRMKCICVIAYV